MNIHVVQTQEGQAEMQEFMTVPTQIIHPRANKPCIGLIQDSLVSAYYLTLYDKIFTETEFRELIMNIKYDCDGGEHLRIGTTEALRTTFNLPIPAIVYPTPYWTGKQIISLCLPKFVNMKRSLKNRIEHPTNKVLNLDHELIIVQGELLSGTMCKQTIGTSTWGLIHYITMYGGYQTGAKFISDISRAVNHYMIKHGFTVGIDDAKLDLQTQAKVKLIVARAEKHIEHLQEIANEMPNDILVETYLEHQISNTLRFVISMIGNTIRNNLDDTNMFNVMTTIVGSRGSTFNLAQIMGIISQIFVKGKRPNKIGTGRVLASQPQLNDPKESISQELSYSGFIKNPYKRGLSMPDAFIHCMGGREGLVDTSTKTASTGYIQRKQVKAAETHHVAYDLTVRDGYDNVFQSKFGLDGYHPEKVAPVTLKYLKKSKEFIKTACGIDLRNQLHKKYFDLVLNLKIEIIESKLSCYTRELNESANLPCNVAHLIEMNRGDDILPNNLEILLEFVNESSIPLYFKYHILVELSPRVLQSINVKPILNLIHKFYKLSLAEPGEAVGALSATSSGEKNTQSTLNSVAYDTEIVILKDSKRIRMSIGKFVDQYIPRHSSDTTNAYYKNLTEPIYISSIDLKGNWSIERIIGVSSHPIHNDDNTGDFVRVTMLNSKSRTVDATLGESFLKFKSSLSNEIEVVKGSDIKLGDFLPIVIEDKYNKTCVVKKDIVADIKRIRAKPFTKIMYDLTVENTKNFVLGNGLAVRDTFKTAGKFDVNMISGLPRMKELINYSKKDKIMSSYISCPLHKNIETFEIAARNIARSLPHTKLEQIMETANIYYEKDYLTAYNPKRDQEMIDSFKPILTCLKSQLSTFFIEFKLDKEKIIVRSLDVYSIAKTLQNELGDSALIIWNHYIIRVYFLGLNAIIKQVLQKSTKPKESSQKKDKNETTDIPTVNKRRKLAIVTDSSQKRYPLQLNLKGDYYDKSQQTTEHVTEYNILEQHKIDLMKNLTCSGIKGIEDSISRKAYVDYLDKETLEVKQKEIYYVDVKGCTIEQLSSMPEFDIENIITNNVNNVYEEYGIDAAAEVLFHELKECLASSGSYDVDDRILSLLVDIITHRGVVLPFSRFGIKNLDNGCLKKITFEEAINQLIDATALGMLDPLKGVSENIMMSKKIIHGTGLSNVVDKDSKPIGTLNYNDDKQEELQSNVIESYVTEYEPITFLGEFNFSLLEPKKKFKFKTSTTSSSTTTNISTQKPKKLLPFESELYSRPSNFIPSSPEIYINQSLFIPQVIPNFIPNSPEF